MQRSRFVYLEAPANYPIKTKEYTTHFRYTRESIQQRKSMENERNIKEAQEYILNNCVIISGDIEDLATANIVFTDNHDIPCDEKKMGHILALICENGDWFGLEGVKYNKDFDLYGLENPSKSSQHLIQALKETKIDFRFKGFEVMKYYKAFEPIIEREAAFYTLKKFLDGDITQTDLYRECLYNNYLGENLEVIQIYAVENPEVFTAYKNIYSEYYYYASRYFTLKRQEKIKKLQQKANKAGKRFIVQMGMLHAVQDIDYTETKPNQIVLGFKDCNWDDEAKTEAVKTKKEAKSLEEREEDFFRLYPHGKPPKGPWE